MLFFSLGAVKHEMSILIFRKNNKPIDLNICIKDLFALNLRLIEIGLLDDSYASHGRV